MTYLFRIPAGTPPCTYAGLHPLATRPGDWDRHKIGTTVTLYDGRGGHRIDTGVLGDAELGPATLARIGDRPWISFVLYNTAIAVLTPDQVAFPAHHYVTQAVGGWLERIVTDNQLGSSVHSRTGTYHAWDYTAGELLLHDTIHPVSGRTRHTS